MEFTAICPSCRAQTIFDESQSSQTHECECGHRFTLMLNRGAVTKPVKKTTNTAVIIIMILLFPLTIYMAPTLVAHQREHHNQGAIFITNLVLGWTVLGWAVALIWAFTQTRNIERRKYWGKP